MAAALSFLHGHRLLHQYQPANIIFIGGEPRLADIGLVVGLDEAHSFVGTSGLPLDVRVHPGRPGRSRQPAPPTLSVSGSPPGHDLELPVPGILPAAYDVRNVSGATGAMAEFSAPGPNTFDNYEMFTNPSGSQRPTVRAC